MRAREKPPGETCNNENSISAPKSMKNKNKNRFTVEQIKSLESIFKLETRLDQKKKMQVARDLGLQPRQVSIWFQNRRARWKSKHLETEFAELKAKFDILKIQIESLNEENKFLLKELESLRNLVKNHNGEESWSKEIGDDGNNSSPVDAHASYSSEHLEITPTNNDNAARLSNNVQEKDEIKSFKFGDYGVKSLDSSEEWNNLGLFGIFNQTIDTATWWDFGHIC